jgi:hypothetical protein
MLIKLDKPMVIIRGGREYKFRAGDVVQTSQFPEAEKTIKAQKEKGRVEKNGIQPDD